MQFTSRNAGPGDRFDRLDALIAERGQALLATATLLAGSRQAGEDLLQSALLRVMRRWHAVRGDPEIYLRRTIYHLAVDSWRVRHRRPEVLTRSAEVLEGLLEGRGRPGQGSALLDPAGSVPLRQTLLAAMAQLPPRQRAVLVLRYWEERTEAETADVLGCSLGTVKSSASRGLARLRELTADWADDQSTLRKRSLT